jgi:hypothetical protein
MKLVAILHPEMLMQTDTAAPSHYSSQLRSSESGILVINK